MAIAAIDEMTIMMVVVAIRKERKGRERERERGGEERSEIAMVIRRKCVASPFSFTIKQTSIQISLNLG